MKPKGIWIAIGLILAVGISSTRLVRQYTSEPPRTKTAETVMETAAPEIAAFSAELEQEEPTERTETETGAFSESGSSVLADGAVPAPAAEIQQSAQSDRTPTVSAGNSQKNAAASENRRISSSAQVSATKQPGNQDILERLEELDRQIEKKRSTKQDTTANSAKAVAESERKLWENELNQLLNGLRRHMSSDTWDAFMKDQNEWIRSREAMAVDALSGNSGSAMQELEYTRSLAEITRDRAYELAEEYYDLLSETE